MQCCAEIMGDSWRKRHDAVKVRITAEATLVGVPVDCEVYNLFGDLLPGRAPMVRGQPAPAPGHLVARFRDFGACVRGSWWLVPGAIHLHQLLKVCAKSWVAAMGRAQGYEAGPNMLGKVMGEVRRAMSVTVVRAQALCLRERLAHLGPGAQAAAQEERRRRERQAFALANQGRGLSRVGRAFIQ